MAEDSNSRSQRVWCEWNALDDKESSPVKRIAVRLNMSTYEVARIVYPPATFGDWADWQEPPLPGETETDEDRRRRAHAEQRGRLREIDDDVRHRALGESG